MTTYTLPFRVSDILATRLAPLADRLETATDAQIEAAALAFADELEAEPNTAPDFYDPVKYKPNAFELEGIGRGFADADTGHVIDSKTALAELRERLRREFPGK